MLGKYGVDIYRNDIHGDILVSTDGNEYWVEVEKEGEPRAPPEEEEEDVSKININNADFEELQELHGIGPS